MQTRTEASVSGKTKSLFRTDDPKQLRLQYRDDLTAFNGEKSETCSGKGALNNCFNAFIMKLLGASGIETHWIKQLSETESLVKHLEMLPVECVVRNWATGSLCRRLGIENKIPLTPPLVEFFLKDDDLGDPLITEAHMLAFKWATAAQITLMSEISLKVNTILSELFARNDLRLVDFKLEFGMYEDRLILGDEFTPDGCRIWDASTLESLDKDLFRTGQGNTLEGYLAAATRLGIPLSLHST